MLRVAGLICLLSAAPVLAQVDTRQPNGPVDLRVDGRPNKREGVPPSAADRAIANQQNDVRRQNCAGAAALIAQERQGLPGPPPPPCN